MKKLRTHYDNLKVSRDAPAEVIRAAYKSLSLKYHPDRNGNSAESQRAMKLINESYATLSDCGKRKRHDEWIANQEAREPTKASESHGTKRSSTNAVPAKIGCCEFDDLPEATRAALKDRATGRKQDQFAIKLNGVIWNYIWTAILFGWFILLFSDATNYRWDGKTLQWYGGICLVVALLLGRNISFIYSWHKSSIKAWLFVTPLYIIRTNLNKVWFWPNWTISNIRATHNYRNGIYQSTSVSISFNGKEEQFSISPEKAYLSFAEKLKVYDARARQAFSNGDIDYFIENDDFESVSTQAPPKTSAFNRSAVAAYSFGLVVSATAYLAALQTNEMRPTAPSFQNSSQNNSRPAVANPSYIKPAVAPSGASWPLGPAYVDGYERERTNGLSSVTVDNSRNDSDVFVRLVYLGNAVATPVRSFYIPAGGSFKVQSVSAGLYDIRYQDLELGGFSKSESFNLSEAATVDGTQFSEMTMTLYKVNNGNMDTFAISPNEFF